jgi:DNA-binding SARP family transcriptional activator
MCPGRVPPLHDGILGDTAGGIVRLLEGTALDAQLAAALGSDGAALSWVRPDRYEQDAESLLRAAARVGGQRRGGAPAMLVIKAAATGRLQRLGARAGLDGSPASTPQWPGDTVVVVEAPPPAPERPSRWRCLGQRAEPDGNRVHQASPAVQRMITDAAERAGMQLGPDARAVLARLGHRPALVHMLLDAAARGMRPGLEVVLARTSDLDGLIAVIVEAILDDLDPDRRSAVILAAQLGYVHESLCSLSACLAEVDRQPWWEPLEDGWYRMLSPWRRALGAWPVDHLHTVRVARLVGELQQADATEEAVDVALRLGLNALGAQVLADCAAAPGAPWVRQPGPWLAELPRSEIIRYPALADVCQSTCTDSPAGDPRDVLFDAAEAVSDARLAQAERGASQARWAARKAGDRATAAEARRLLTAVRRVEAAVTGAQRVRSVLSAAGLAARIVGQPDHEPAGGVPSPRTRPATAPKPAATHQEPRKPEPHGRPVLEIAILGTVEVTVGGQAVREWSGGLGRALLAYLVHHHPQPVPRDRLLTTFWPDVPQKSARNRLHVALHDLRRDLAAVTSLPVVTYRNGAYGLNPTLTLSTDVERVAHLVRMAEDIEPTDPPKAIGMLSLALNAYRGDFCDVGQYDAWTLVEREHHHRRRLDSTIRLACLQLDARDEVSCLETCRNLLAEDPCDTNPNMMAMRAHARLGQHHLALRQFERYRRKLRAELALAPDPATVRLYEAIRQRERV